MTALVLASPVVGFEKMMTTIGVSPETASTISDGIKIAVGIVTMPVNPALGIGFIVGGTGGILNRYTDMPPIVNQIIGISAAAVGAFAAGGFDAGTLSGALGGLKTALPYLAMDFASAGLVGIGDTLGLDGRLTALISTPIRASVGAITGNALGLGGQYNDILGKIASGTIGGLVSVGSSIGLDAIGAPPVLQSFVPGILGQLAASATGSTGGGGGSGEVTSEAQGQSIFSKIGDGIKKFGQGIANTTGSVLSFGAKAIEGVGHITAEGFKSAINGFSSLFSRQTQESIYADVTGLRGADVSVDGNIWSYQSGDTRIVYDTVTDTLTEDFGIGGVARIEGLVEDDLGNFFYQKLTYENITADGGLLTQIYEDNVLTLWTYNASDGNVVSFIGQDKSSFDANGYLLDGVMAVSGNNAEYQIADGRIQNIDIDYSADLSAVTPPAEMEQPWFEKYALSNAADASDAWLDQTADWIIGEAEATNGWILKATAVNTVKDVIKATITDVVRLGDQIPLMGQNWNDMWAAWHAGQPVDSAFKFLALGGNIITETGRALVIGSVAKGLAVAAIRSTGTFASFLSLNEQGFLRIASEDWSSAVSRWLKSESADDIAALRSFFQNNPELKAKFLAGVKEGSRDIREVATALKKGALGVDDVSDFKILNSADEVNLNPKYTGYDPLPHKPGTQVIEKVGSAEELVAKKWVRVHGDDNIARPWMMEESQYLQLKSEANTLGVDFGDYLQQKLQLPAKPTKASYFQPQGEEFLGYRESIVNNPSSPNENLKQIEIVLEEGKRLKEEWFAPIGGLND